MVNIGVQCEFTTFVTTDTYLERILNYALLKISEKCQEQYNHTLLNADNEIGWVLKKEGGEYIKNIKLGQAFHSARILDC